MIKIPRSLKMAKKKTTKPLKRPKFPEIFKIIKVLPRPQNDYIYIYIYIHKTFKMNKIAAKPQNDHQKKKPRSSIEKWPKYTGISKITKNTPKPQNDQTVS